VTSEAHKAWRRERGFPVEHPKVSLEEWLAKQRMTCAQCGGDMSAHVRARGARGWSSRRGKVRKFCSRACTQANYRNRTGIRSTRGGPAERLRESRRLEAQERNLRAFRRLGLVD